MNFLLLLKHHYNGKISHIHPLLDNSKSINRIEMDYDEALKSIYFTIFQWIFWNKSAHTTIDLEFSLVFLNNVNGNSTLTSTAIASVIERIR